MTPSLPTSTIPFPPLASMWPCAFFIFALASHYVSAHILSSSSSSTAYDGVALASNLTVIDPTTPTLDGIRKRGSTWYLEDDFGTGVDFFK